jgi:hypothetical protein
MAASSLVIGIVIVALWVRVIRIKIVRVGVIVVAVGIVGKVVVTVASISRAGSQGESQKQREQILGPHCPHLTPFPGLPPALQLEEGWAASSPRNILMTASASWSRNYLI